MRPLRVSRCTMYMNLGGITKQQLSSLWDGSFLFILSPQNMNESIMAMKKRVPLRISAESSHIGGREWMKEREVHFGAGMPSILGGSPGDARYSAEVSASNEG